MRKLLRFRFDRIFKTEIRKEKKVRSRPGQAQAGARPVASATRPAHPALAWPAQAGGRPAGSGCLPAQPHCQAGPRPGAGRASCPFLFFFLCWLMGCSVPAQAGCWPAAQYAAWLPIDQGKFSGRPGRVLGAAHFCPQRPLFVASYKKGFFPNFLV